MRVVELRTSTGLSRHRAGLHVASTWAPFEVSDEQLERLRADKAIEVREPHASIARRVGDAEAAALEASSDLQRTIEELTRTAQKLAGATQEAEELRGDLGREKLKVERLEREAERYALEDKQIRAQVAELEARIASGPTVSASLEQTAPDALAIANGELRARVEQLEVELAALRGTQTPAEAPAAPAATAPTSAAAPAEAVAAPQGGKKGKG